jgi:hypothetical protein
MKKAEAKVFAETPESANGELTESQSRNGNGGSAVPSWFVRTYPTEGAGDLAARYRESPDKLSQEDGEDIDAAYENYRRRLEDRFRMAQHMVDEQIGLTAVQPEHAPAQRRRAQFDTETPRFARRNRQRGGILGVSMPVAVLLTALACGLGSAGGYFMANPKALQGMAATSVATLGNLFGANGKQVATNNVTTISSKNIKIAEVNVADVAGSVNAPIALEISALPPDGKTPIALRISGLPPDSYLTAGVQVKQGEWVLRPEEIQSAQLIVQKADSPELGLFVTALDAMTGAEAAPAKTMKVALDLNAVPTPGLQPPPDTQNRPQQQVTVTPVNAVPDQGFNKPAALPQAVPPPKEVLRGESASFLEKGDMLLKAGDIIAARQFYLRAFELEDPAGAYGVARTYDPKIFAELNVQGLSPDPAKAKEWYGKAAAGGHADASQELLTPPQ